MAVDDFVPKRGAYEKYRYVESLTDAQVEDALHSIEGSVPLDPDLQGKAIEALSEIVRVLLGRIKELEARRGT